MISRIVDTVLFISRVKIPHRQRHCLLKSSMVILPGEACKDAACDQTM